MKERQLKFMPFNPYLGRKAKHIISGYEGLITGFAQHMTGCDMYALTPTKIDEKGKPAEGRWFDENEIVLIEKASKKIVLGVGERELIEPVSEEVAEPRGCGEDPSENFSSISKN